MQPIPVPEQAEAARPLMSTHRVGPPRGISDEDCGTVESLVGYIDGMSAYCDYWRPTTDELERLNKGAFIELVQYTPQMAMHSMSIWPVPETS